MFHPDLSGILSKGPLRTGWESNFYRGKQSTADWKPGTIVAFKKISECA